MSIEYREETVIPETVLIQLWAQKDRGLKLIFDDLLAGLERAKVPFGEGIVVDQIVDRTLEAYRDRVSGRKGYDAKSFRVSRTAELGAE